MSELSAREKQIAAEASRCLGCKNPLCSKFCPIGNDIPRFLKFAAAGDFAAAARTIAHPFGGICGVVCPHFKQCEGHCVLGIKGRPVQIGRTEAFVSSRFVSSVERADGVLAGRKISVIGGGVSGLTFAAYVYGRGADVTVYEKGRLFGALRQIPSFRLDVKVLQKILAEFENSRIKFVSANVDKRLFDSIREESDAVYVATGLTIPLKAGMAGEEQTTVTAEHCLTNAVMRGETIIIGGGNTAMDCARTVVRSGGKATVVYRRSKEEMPAFPEEIRAAEKDGVAFVFNRAPVSALRKGRIIEAVFAKTYSENRGKLTVTDEKETFRCDGIVTALGNRFDPSPFGEAWATERGVVVDGNGKAADKIYSGGDVTGGECLAAIAVSDALRAAASCVRDITEKK